MQKTDLMELKKRFKYPDAAFSSMACCYVKSMDGDEERVVFSGEGKYLVRDEDEQKAFSSLLSKAFSFSKTVSCEDVDVSDGDMKKLLLDYSRKDDHSSFGLKELVDVVVSGYEELSGYSIVIFRDDYDIIVKDSSKTKTDESEEVYQYLALMICPVKPITGGLSPSDGDIHKSGVIKQLGSPVFGLIYPSFEDRSSDTEHAFVCCRGENERSLVEKLFSQTVKEPEKKASVKKEFLSSITDLETGSEEINAIIEDVKRGDGQKLREDLMKLDAGLPALNNIDDALLSKKASSAADDDDDGQVLEIKEDKSSVTMDRVTERDIGGRKYFIIPRDLLPDDVLDVILSLGSE